ncbi:DUF4129 domain-containing protein [Phytoactinopolyspora halotolerans]|uniref:DUF4129 domain-containing protein n=1 Tax=Phytoactinopolyspora halotolerans TaxID=1981512 RepID=A0A6L9SAT8_9ACTN|nr:DUF4129 domain-containing protein [Phytoactinopolyspora halotolerans]NEE02475.1 DUF4129 domain-containing protein [Phytoactinopolyspora halotolerans]
MITVLFGVPIDLDRDEARDLAREELSRPGYERDVSLPARVLEWLLEQFNRLVSGAAGAIPGGLGTALILAAAVAVAIVVVLRTGPLARRRRERAGAVFTEARRTSAEHRAAADEAAATQEWSTAVLERFRAVVTGLEERGVVDRRSGWTASELARHAGERLPDTARQLATGAHLFDHVRYGGRIATADDDTTMRSLDDAARNARPRTTAETSPQMAVPR